MQQKKNNYWKYPADYKNRVKNRRPLYRGFESLYREVTFVGKINKYKKLHAYTYIRLYNKKFIFFNNYRRNPVDYDDTCVGVLRVNAGGMLSLFHIF